MLFLFTVINLLIFLLLSAIHFYWLIGGKWRLSAAIPTHVTGDKAVFTPSTFATFVVALGLLGMAFIEYNYLSQTIVMTPQYHKVASMIITLIFTLRALGDFNYVGIFKKVKTTPFAKNDTAFYTPLCIWLAITQAVIYYQNPF